ncbi:MAG: nuclear transport factor 2 family protein [Proteobacteria bacterium]|nr:MAG: nuclear transport factor 2 family protein [Pseudomonadota bacterium]
MMLVAAILVAIVIVFIVYANRFELTRSDESIDVDAMMREETPVEEQITTQGVAAQGQKKERPLAKEVDKPQRMVVGATPSQEQAVPLPSEAEPGESDSPSFKKSKPVTVAKTAESLVESSDEFERKESADTLSALLHRFVSSYETGNLDQFMTLFAEDAQTNERRNRDEIRTDYDDLFQTTDRRRLKLIDINWEPGNHAVQGWGRFEVKVRKKGKPEVTTYIGGLRFRVEKPGPQLRITHLYHTQTKVNVTVSDVE